MKDDDESTADPGQLCIGRSDAESCGSHLIKTHSFTTEADVYFDFKASGYCLSSVFGRFGDGTVKGIDLSSGW